MLNKGLQTLKNGRNRYRTSRGYHELNCKSSVRPRPWDSYVSKNINNYGLYDKDL